MKESLSTKLENRLGLATWEIALYLLLLAIAAVMHFWGLGQRAYHHDESMHAQYSWMLYKGLGYEHNPMMHGPFQFHFTALVFKIFGASDYTARLLPAIFGTLVVGLPYFLRGQLGRAGSLLASAFLVFSPSMLYFGRFARNDIYIVFWTLLLVICMWRYTEQPKARYLYLGAAALSWSFVTKEVTYINIAIFLLFLLVVAFKDVVARLKDRLSLSRLSPAGAFMLVLATLTLPQLSAGIGIFQKWLGIVLINSNESAGAVGIPQGTGLVVAALTVLAFIIISILIGWRWNPRYWLVCAAIFYGIYILLYTTLLTHPLSFGSGIWGSLGYWLVQHGVRRGAQPWFYYLILLSLYEFLPLVFALAGTVYYSFKGSLFSRFLIYWAGASIILYSIAGEKMPWLALHMALPLILLASKFCGELLAGKITKKLNLRLATAVVLCLLLALTLRTAWRASYQQDDTRQEMMVYAQISPDVLPIRDEIDRLAEQTGQGKKLGIIIDTGGGYGLSWPWTWYLRDYKAVSYRNLNSVKELPPASVLMVSWENRDTVKPFLASYGQGREFRQLTWFPEVYRSLEPHQFLEGQSWRSWWRYFMYREISKPYWDNRAIVYFAKPAP